MNNKKLIFLITAFVLIAAAVYFFSTSIQQTAVTETPAKARIIKIVSTHRDIASAQKTPDDNSERMLQVLTIPAGTQIVSLTTNVREAFSFPDDSGISAISLRAEIDGIEVSSGDIAALPALNIEGIYNQRSTTNESGLYSVDRPTSIVLRVHSDSNIDVAGLRSGILEFYITVISI